MLGKRSDQKGLWEADRLYLGYVGKETFYGLLASLRASCSAMTILPRSTVRTMAGTACRPACRTHGHERGAKNGWKACDRCVEVQENVRLRVLR